MLALLVLDALALQLLDSLALLLLSSLALVFDGVPSPGHIGIAGTGRIGIKRLENRHYNGWNIVQSKFPRSIFFCSVALVLCSIWLVTLFSILQSLLTPTFCR